MQPSTKGQTQLIETILVVLVFTFVLIFALGWFSRASQADALQEEVELKQQQLLETAKIILNQAEIRCTTSGVRDTTCVDIHRVLAVQEETQIGRSLHQYYQELYQFRGLGRYNATIRSQFPSETITETVFNFTTGDPNASVLRIALPITIYNATNNTKMLGILEVIQES